MAVVHKIWNWTMGLEEHGQGSLTLVYLFLQKAFLLFPIISYIYGHGFTMIRNTCNQILGIPIIKTQHAHFPYRITGRRTIYVTIPQYRRGIKMMSFAPDCFSKWISLPVLNIKKLLHCWKIFQFFHFIWLIYNIDM